MSTVTRAIEKRHLMSEESKRSASPVCWCYQERLPSKTNDQRVEMRKISSKLLGKKRISRKREHPEQVSCGRRGGISRESEEGWMGQGRKCKQDLRELRMGPLAGPCWHRPSGDFAFIWRMLEKIGKGEQHGGPAEECALESVMWSRAFGRAGLVSVGPAATLKGRNLRQ